MVGGRLGDSINMREDLIKKACSLSLKAHTYKSSSGKPYLLEKIRGSSEAVFTFPGSYSLDDWYNNKSFGETEVDLNLFPSLRSIGNNEVATVNQGFLRRFKLILQSSSFTTEVKKAVAERKPIIFAGHSSGAPTAILATLWFLEEYLRPNLTKLPPLCVTFGSPLVGDRIVSHALKRENWSKYFINFVMRYDIVPRIMLAPFSSIEQQGLQTIIHYFNPKSSLFRHDLTMDRIITFFAEVMRNVSSVASQAACHLMGCTNPLLETLTSFIELSPYRPFGTYIFCTGNGKMVVVENPDAVLQLLFYSSQLTSESDYKMVAYESLKQHLGYESELQDSLEMQDVVYLKKYLRELPLSSVSTLQGELDTVNTALKDLGLSVRARLCLRAAGELEKQKQINKDKINSNKREIEVKLRSIQDYKSTCDVRKLGYYDTFKVQNHEQDFQANVKRLELAGLWDEIIEMLKRYELPDEFEGQKEWIELGTVYRRLVEPLDIANYYRHLKNEDTGPYLMNPRGPRPKRYMYTQRWHEHAERFVPGTSTESCFWAKVEELRSGNKLYDDMKNEILQLERNVLKWFQNKQVGEDVFFDASTFAKWWKTLPYQHRAESCIKGLLSG